MTTTYHAHVPGHTDLAALAEEPPRSRAAVAGLALAVVAAVALALAGLGSRWGWWDFRTGFTILRWAFYLALAAAAVSAVGIFLAARPGRRGVAMAVAGLVIALGAAAIPWRHRASAQGAPPIHDVTTDLENPPAFVQIAPLRADAPNPAAYEGEQVAAAQREAYPDLQPLRVSLPIPLAFDEARAAAEAMGWQVVHASREEGRIEATDRTFWFGFEDDVVIRLTSDSGLTRVDVRSKSRVGRGDMGTNARRVRDYLEQLRRRPNIAPNVVEG